MLLTLLSLTRQDALHMALVVLKGLYLCFKRYHVRGKSKITKKGKIKFATSKQKMVSYDRSLIIGGPKEDGNIGRIS